MKILPPKAAPATRTPRLATSGWGPLPAILAVAACALTAKADVIFQDDFESADQIENVSVIDSKSSWEASGQRDALSVVADPGGLNSGNALVLGNGAVMLRISPTVLGVGDSLVLSLRFRSPDEKVEFPSPLRIGLCESRDDAPDTGDTIGYWLATEPGAEAKTSIFLEKNEDSIGGGNDRTALGEAFLLELDWLKPRQLTLTVVRVAESLVEIHAELDGTRGVVRADPKAAVTHFNLLAFRLANGPQSKLLIDDVKLEVLKAAE